MRSVILVLLFLGLASVVIVGRLRVGAREHTPLQELKASLAKKRKPSADHAKFEVLKAKFDSPKAVTAACLGCHTERGKEVMASTHWNWAREEFVPGHGIRRIGKKNLLNNYCVGVAGNLQACDKCHAGYGYVDQEFDFGDENAVDCLVCHDNSGSYARTARGQPAPTVDLNVVAQSVGRPTRANCGSCHFFGGGGNNVKHGDLEEVLLSPSHGVDVHMSPDGGNLECVDCHVTENHRMKGKLYSVSSMNRDRSSCEQCHGSVPHEDDMLDEHTLKLACQTCHIPTYAKSAATKMTWDWSTAGKMKDGKPYEEKDADGNILYTSKKGSFGWKKNAVPEYLWFDGTAGHYLLGDEINGSGPVAINELQGAPDEIGAKIIPAKVHRGRQLYDPVHKTLIQPKLVAPKKGEGAFWKDYDWEAAAQAGMKEAGLPYSGQHDFISTTMTWPVNHMVAPASEALKCSDCHRAEGSRLAGVGGVYLPGRDRDARVERYGRLALLIALAGVGLHLGGRLVTSRLRRGRA